MFLTKNIELVVFEWICGRQGWKVENLDANDSRIILYIKKLKEKADPILQAVSNIW